jgi:glutamate-1-semialdehyde 2,1-aminomutase
MSASQELATTLDLARAKYVRQNPRSEALHAEALNSLPGGNTRAVLHADPFPLYIKSGRGYQVTTEDDKMCVPPDIPDCIFPVCDY